MTEVKQMIESKTHSIIIASIVHGEKKVLDRIESKKFENKKLTLSEIVEKLNQDIPKLQSWLDSLGNYEITIQVTPFFIH